jgi:hypothetical protein
MKVAQYEKRVCMRHLLEKWDLSQDAKAAASATIASRTLTLSGVGIARMRSLPACGHRVDGDLS